jgi:3-oxoacyl-[acyl-carrier protein] reductase
MKIHLITGAASGIGFELARTLLQRGDTVVACDLQLQPMEKLSAYATAPSHLRMQPLDVRDPGRWNAAMQAASALGRVDTVMNVAGVMRVNTIDSVPDSDVDLLLDVNTKGTILGTQAAFRVMRNQTDDRGRGHIINIASLAGVAPIPGAALYTASKFAVRGYSLAVAQELKQYGIALTVVCPDAVATPMVAPFTATPEAAVIFSASRLLTIQEVVDAIVKRAMITRPLEVTLPRSRSALAKIASAWPGLAGMLSATMTRRGLRNQSRRKS